MAMAKARGDQGREISVESLLKSEQVFERLKAFAPNKASAERLHGLAALAVQNEPNLKKVEPFELIRAMVGVTSLGLEINSPMQHAWLIPFQKRGEGMILQVIIGYQGYMELGFRTGELRGIRSNIVTAEEVKTGLFKYNLGTDGFIQHQYGVSRDEDHDPKVDWADDDPNKPMYAYAIADMKDGGYSFAVLPWTHIVRARNGSPGYGYAKDKGTGSATFLKNPWVAHEFAMGEKTAIRYLFKRVRKSPEIASAESLEVAGELGEKLKTVVDLNPADWQFMTGAPKQVEDNTDDKKDGTKRDGDTTEREADPKKTQTKGRSTKKKAEDDGPPAGHPAAGDEPDDQATEEDPSDVDNDTDADDGGEDDGWYDG